jgi:ferrous iron transport protein B
MTAGATQPQAHAEPARHTIAVVGNPNTGKSTLFNALTGLRQKTGNYPGVTVEKHTGTATLASGEVTLVDVPGTYSLAAQSPDEMVAVDVLAGAYEDLGRPDAVLAVVDATNLRRNLYLVSQVLEQGLPVVIALNMVDAAEKRGIRIDHRRLGELLHATVVPTVASKGQGLDALREALDRAVRHGTPAEIAVLPELRARARELAESLRRQGIGISDYAVERALIDEGGYAEQRLVRLAGEDIRERLQALRREIGQGKPLPAMEARARYEWINRVVSEVERRAEAPVGLSDRIDRIVSHPFLGSVLFVLVMGLVFQAVFAWATPLMDWIDGLSGDLSEAIHGALPEGAVASLLADGVVAGVGSVVIFLPQILILYAFIILLEDTGYMARAAFLMDRLMRWCGLSGKSFIPMLSSFACAVPGIMATRVIPDRRDRLATILAAPFMTCSARLPVYALLIAAFVPRQTWLGGWVNLQGLVLLSLYLLGILGGVLTAWLLKRTLLRGPTPTFLMELPPYRIPNLRSMLLRLWDRARIFLRRAGTIIFTVAVVIWALAYFPRPVEVHEHFEVQREAAATLPAAQREARLQALDDEEAAAYLEQSYLGRMGQAIAPAFAPLGWDWKVSAAVIAGFPAREVVIAVLGTIYAVGSDVDEESEALAQRLASAAWPDGSPVFTLHMVLGMLVFYAFCLQCAATVVTIGRETNHWGWAAFAWVYMTTLGYLGALLVFQAGSRLA